MATLLGRLPLATLLGRLSLMLLLALSHALTIPTTLRAHRGNKRIERVRAYWYALHPRTFLFPVRLHIRASCRLASSALL